LFGLTRQNPETVDVERDKVKPDGAKTGKKPVVVKRKTESTPADSMHMVKPKGAAWWKL
jgi:hypothetical protein